MKNFQIFIVTIVLELFTKRFSKTTEQEGINIQNSLIVIFMADNLSKVREGGLLLRKVFWSLVNAVLGVKEPCNQHWFKETKFKNYENKKLSKVELHLALWTTQLLINKKVSTPFFIGKLFIVHQSDYPFNIFLL